jgi:hypothetical protein
MMVILVGERRLEDIVMTANTSDSVAGINQLMKAYLLQPDIPPFLTDKYDDN